MRRGLALPLLLVLLLLLLLPCPSHSLLISLPSSSPFSSRSCSSAGFHSPRRCPLPSSRQSLSLSWCSRGKRLLQEGVVDLEALFRLKADSHTYIHVNLLNLHLLDVHHNYSGVGYILTIDSSCSLPTCPAGLCNIGVALHIVDSRRTCSATCLPRRSKLSSRSSTNTLSHALICLALFKGMMHTHPRQQQVALLPLLRGDRIHHLHQPLVSHRSPLLLPLLAMVLRSQQVYLLAR